MCEILHIAYFKTDQSQNPDLSNICAVRYTKEDMYYTLVITANLAAAIFHSACYNTQGISYKCTTEQERGPIYFTLKIPSIPREDLTDISSLKINAFEHITVDDALTIIKHLEEQGAKIIDTEKICSIS